MKLHLHCILHWTHSVSVESGEVPSLQVNIDQVFLLMRGGCLLNPETDYLQNCCQAGSIFSENLRIHTENHCQPVSRSNSKPQPKKQTFDTFFFLSSAFLGTKLQLYNKSLSNVSRRSSSPDLLHKLISFQGNSTDTEIAFFKG